MFRAEHYGEEVARILNAAGGGQRVMPLVQSGRGQTVSQTAVSLFPNAPEAAAAMAGLHLYLGNWEAAHMAADSVERPSNYYWHAIVHRQEPDSWNSSYWFGRAGRHPVFTPLRERAAQLGYDAGREWNPGAFIDYCEAARLRPGSDEEQLAMKVQLVEWQLLFDYCARGRN